MRARAQGSPADFDPGTHPILAIHFFGVDPPHPINQIAAEVVADLRRRRQVERLHRPAPNAPGFACAGIEGAA